MSSGGREPENFQAERPDLRRREAMRAILVGSGLLGLQIGSGFTMARAATSKPGAIRILHIMSYHASWQWNRDQFDAFREVLSDLDVEYEVLEMDMKRRSEPAWREEISMRALERIESWQPDLVYTNDDYAQEYVVQRYPANGVPFVFSAVNSNPQRYGFDRRRDVTGVLEQEHYVETLNLLREIVPGARRIAVLMDKDPTWNGVKARMQVAFAGLPDLEVVSWDTLMTYDDYKHRVLEYQNKVDALAVLGVFNLKDEQGRDVPFETVLRWTTENSKLPDFSFWTSRVELGTLVSVSVSGHEQGRLAGEMAREILVDGRSPDAIPMRPTLKGQPAVSLARARLLGIQIPSSTLLKSQVLTGFAWES